MFKHLIALISSDIQDNQVNQVLNRVFFKSLDTFPERDASPRFCFYFGLHHF